jgi:hypothetical protein
MLENKLLIEPTDTPQLSIQNIVFCTGLRVLYVIWKPYKLFSIKGRNLSYGNAFNSASPIDFDYSKRYDGYQNY